MNYQNVNVIFGDTDPGDWNKLNPRFLNLLFAFFAKEGIKEIFVNSTFRAKPVGSFHAVGMALDLHYVKYASGKVIFFSRREPTYNRQSDIAFSNSVISFFEKYRIEYFSPSRMYSVNADRFNKYAGENKASIDKKLTEKKLGKTADLDRDHLDHLHFAINPDPTAKPKAQIKNAAKTILPAAIFFF